MNIYRKIFVVFSNFNNKLISGITFGKKNVKKIGKKFVKVQVSIIRLNQKRPNTYNQSVEK